MYYMYYQSSHCDPALHSEPTMQK